MIYNYIELVGCVRLELNNIHTLRISFTDAIQLILGRNGSGKSSVMEQLSPLPPDKEDFSKDGYRFIKITHLGNVYELKNWFSPSPKNSFKKNGEELNPGHTGNVQKELARQEFGYTQNINSLANGYESFTGMGPSQRREWLTQLSTVSYDFAIKQYDKLAKKARDIDGQLRGAKERLVAETGKIISDEERQALRRSLDESHKELSVLLNVRAPVTQDPEEISKSRTHHLEEINRLSMRLLRMKFVAPYGVDSRQPVLRDEWHEPQLTTFYSVAEIEEHITYLRGEMAKAEGQNSRAVAEHDKLQRKLDLLNKTGNESLADLQARHQKALAKKLEHLTKLRTDFEFTQPEAALEALQSIGPELTEAALNLPINPNRKYSSQALESTRREELAILDKMHRNQHDAGIVQARVEHMEGHRNSSKAECPSCNHRFVIGFSERELNDAKQALENLGKVREGLEADLASCREAIETQASYGEKLRVVSGLMRGRPALEPIWLHIGEHRLLFETPSAITNVLYNAGFDLVEHVEAMKYQKEADEIQTLIAAAEQVGDASALEVKYEMEVIHNQIEAYTREINRLRGLITECDVYRRQLMDAFALSEKLKNMIEYVETLTHKEVEMIRLQSLQHCIEHLQFNISRSSQLLRGVEIQESLIKDLEGQIKKLTRQQEAYKLIVQNLSPTKGLIADGLLGFIRIFTNSMNAVIRKIWTYPLEVKPCGISVEGSAELDYKFPLKVGGSPRLRKDISKGSSAMIEIIDLAFVLTALKFSGMSDVPLKLDEFGRGFDKEHRFKSAEVIKSMVEQQMTPQLFMISHYEDGHGVMTHAQICVLDRANITLPSVYNEHVVIA